MFLFILRIGFLCQISFNFRDHSSPMRSTCHSALFLSSLRNIVTWMNKWGHACLPKAFCSLKYWHRGLDFLFQKIILWRIIIHRVDPTCLLLVSWQKPPEFVVLIWDTVVLITSPRITHRLSKLCYRSSFLCCISKSMNLFILLKATWAHIDCDNSNRKSILLGLDLSN